MVFGFFSYIEAESYIFAVFRRKTSVWTKAVFFAVAGLQFIELMFRWKCYTVDIYIYIHIRVTVAGKVVK